VIEEMLNLREIRHGQDDSCGMGKLEWRSASFSSSDGHPVVDDMPSILVHRVLHSGLAVFLCSRCPWRSLRDRGDLREMGRGSWTFNHRHI